MHVLSLMLLAPLFHDAATSTGVSENLLRAVCWAESSGRIMVVNHNDSGSASIGLCQVKDSTARWLGFKGPTRHLLTPRVNIRYAALYLAYQLKRYHGDWRKAVTAYNRGHFSGTGNNRYVEHVAKAMREGR